MFFLFIFFILTDAFSIHGMGFGKCGSKEVPTVKFPDDFVSEVFYTFKLGEGGTAGVSGIYVDDTNAYFPRGKLLTGYYTKKSVALSQEESGVFEWTMQKNPASLFSSVASSPMNCGAAESLMPVEQSGLYTQNDVEAALAVKAQMENLVPNFGEECIADDAEDYSAERERMINEYNLLSQAWTQSAQTLNEPGQRDALLADPMNLPDNTEYRQRLADAFADKSLPLHDSEHNMMGVGCHHFPGTECRDIEIQGQEYFSLELNKQIEAYSGFAQFAPVHQYTIISASSFVQYNQELNQLEFTFHAHNMFHNDPDDLGVFENTNFMGKPNVEVTHQNPITMEQVAPTCPLNTIASKLPDFQQFRIWTPLEEACPPDVQEEFRQALKAQDWDVLRPGSSPPPPPAEMTPEEIAAMMQAMELRVMTAVRSVSAMAAKYFNCANKYFQSWIPHSHGFGLMESAVLLHMIIELDPDSLVDLFTNPDVNTFNIDYIYSNIENQCGGRNSGCTNIGLGDGDCDSDNDCRGSLICGSNNCGDFRDSTGWLYNEADTWDMTDDCCMEPIHMVPISKDATFSTYTIDSAPVHLAVYGLASVGCFALVWNAFTCLARKEEYESVSDVNQI